MLSSVRGKEVGLPIEIKVPPRINLQFIFRFLIISSIHKVDFEFISISYNGFSKDFL